MLECTQTAGRWPVKYVKKEKIWRLGWPVSEALRAVTTTLSNNAPVVHGTEASSALLFLEGIPEA
jgi:hypothetical protein